MDVVKASRGYSNETTDRPRVLCEQDQKLVNTICIRQKIIRSRLNFGKETWTTKASGTNIDSSHSREECTRYDLENRAKYTNNNSFYSQSL